MKYRFWFALVAALAWGGNADGQDTLLISQQDIVVRLQNENLQAKIAEKAYLSARADYQQTNAIFLPSITASHTAMLTTNPLMAFGSKLNQEILTQADFNPTLLNNPDKTRNFATDISVLMPIFNMDGIYGRQAAKAKMEAFELQAGRTKEYLEMEAIKTFLQLQMAYEALEVIEKAVNTTQANVRLIENYFDQGLVQQTDILAMQIRLSEVQNQHQYAQSNVKNASDYLAFLLNEQIGDAVYKPAEFIRSEIAFTHYKETVPESRKDIMAMNKSQQAYENMYKSVKMEFIPRLNAFGSYQLYDKQLFHFGASGYIVGAQLSWAVFDGYKTVAKTEKNRIEYEKAQIETEQYLGQSNLELAKTQRQLDDAINKIRLTGLALEQSEEAYRIRNDRFREGLEKTTDMLTADSQMVQKALEHTQAIYEYNVTKQYIEFLIK